LGVLEDYFTILKIYRQNFIIKAFEERCVFAGWYNLYIRNYGWVAMVV